MTTSLVLSTFHGIDLLGDGFRDAGYCVVLCGDPLFGQRGITPDFHPPAGAFEGVLGSPPCQLWAQAHNLSGDKAKYANLIPEFERIVQEAQPRWWFMENVTGAPIPFVEDYHIQDIKLYAWELGSVQRRRRRFTFGSKPPVLLLWPHGERPPRGVLTIMASEPVMPSHRERLPTVALEDGHQADVYTLTANPRVHSNRNGRKVYPTPTATNSPQRPESEEKAARGNTHFSLNDYRLGFGLPPEWNAPALLQAYKFKVLGNAVPIEVAQALARAIKQAVGEGGSL